MHFFLSPFSRSKHCFSWLVSQVTGEFGIFGDGQAAEKLLSAAAVKIPPQLYGVAGEADCIQAVAGIDVHPWLKVLSSNWRGNHISQFCNQGVPLIV